MNTNVQNLQRSFADLSTDEKKILLQRNKIKNYSKISTHQKLDEELAKIKNIEQEIPVQIENKKDLSALERRVLAQRLGINSRKSGKHVLETKINEKINQDNIADINPKPVKNRFSIKKDLLKQAKDGGYRNYSRLSIEKLKDLLSKPPIKKLLKSDLVEQAKKLGFKVNQTFKKSFLESLINPQLTFKETNSAFRGYVKQLTMAGLPKMDVKNYLNHIKDTLTQKIRQENTIGLKCVIILYVLMKRKNEEQEFQLRSRHTLAKDENIHYDNMIKTMLTELDNLIQKGSGWKLIEIMRIDLHTVNHEPFGGSSYIPLPIDIQRKFAVINVKNDDKKCFRYSIEAALLNIEIHPERMSNYNRPELDLMFEHLEYPVKIKDIDIFEKTNIDYAINVYTFIRREWKEKIWHEIVPRRISNKILTDETKYINLLYYKDSDDIDESEELDQVSDNANYHYAWIKNFSRLVSKQHSKRNGAVKICYRCLKIISAATNELRDENYKVHLETCAKFECSKISMPNPKNNMLKFKDFKFQQKHPVVIVADFESTLKKIDSKVGDKTVQKQEHIPNSYSVFIQFDKSQINQNNQLFTHIQQNEDEVVAVHFVNKIEALCTDIGRRFLLNPKPMDPLTETEQKEHTDSKLCYLCKEGFSVDNPKVRDHDHFSGKYRGSACNKCNINYTTPQFIPVYFHNLSGYDAHLFVKHLGGDVRVIANNSENYISFSKVLSIEDKKIEIRFLDSFRLMQASLDSLATNLPEDEKKNLKDHFPNNDRFKLLLKKGKYPYDWSDTLQKMEYSSLPTQKEFYSPLNNTYLSKDDYQHALTVWEKFECKTFRDYHRLYLETDVLLLADILENFRNTCLKHYRLDPAWFYTAPGLSWQAMLKMTGVHLELLTDSDMYSFFELGIRGGICVASLRYAKAEPGKSHIAYIDMNNLYGKGLSANLPYKDFKWMTEEEFADWESIPCTLEVDLEYPKHLHDLHNSYPLAPEHLNDKLIPNLYNKKKYVIHHSTLKLYLSLGLKLQKIHRGISYTECDFLAQYINFNTKLRAKAQNEFEKDFFKLLNNSIFGKCMESVRLRENYTFATSVSQLRKAVNSNNYRSHKIFSENLVLVNRLKNDIYLNKPIYIGQACLDISKNFMYDWHYNYMMKKYAGRSQMCYTDTDSLVYLVETPDFYADMKEDSHLYDLSNFPKTHPMYSDANKKAIGFMKDEEPANKITEFIALRSKLYAYTTQSNAVIKKAKGVKKCVIKKEISFDEYKHTLFQKMSIEKEMMCFRSRNHNLYTEKIQKVALDGNDDKRHILPDGISTLAHGHYKIT